MTAPVYRGPVVIDTGVFGADLVRRSELAERFDPVIAGRPAFVSFQTVAELYCGAFRRGWGEQRMQQLRARIAAVEVVYVGPELVVVYARLRVECSRIGHALSQRDHDADRWIAATAVRLGVPLVSDDRIFADVPGLAVETA